MPSRISSLVIVAFALFLSVNAYSGEQGGVTITVPEGVERALDDVGIHIERQGADSGLKQAALIAGGVVLAAIIVAVAVRKKKAP